MCTKLKFHVSQDFVCEDKTKDFFSAMWTTLIPDLLIETTEVPLRVKHCKFSLKFRRQFKEPGEASEQSAPSFAAINIKAESKGIITHAWKNNNMTKAV